MNGPLILCNERGEHTGLASWEEAHASPGKLHLAFSIYIFRNGKEEFLIQRRSGKKALFPRILANTCCSHPRENQLSAMVAPLRLMQECGFTALLRPGGTLVYSAEDPNGNGAEHEYVEIFTGEIEDDTELNPNPDEVESLEWIKVDELQTRMKSNPDEFAPWFHLGLQKILDEQH